MKRSIIIASSIFLMALALIGGRRTFQELTVKHTGKIVEMELTSINGPCYYSKRNTIGVFSFQGETYYHKVHHSFCEDHKPGDKIELFFSDESEIVLFPEENPWNQAYGTIGLFLLGIYGIFLALKQTSRHR